MYLLTAGWVSTLLTTILCFPENDKTAAKTLMRRIVGGTEAERGEFPFMAMLITEGRLFCGGSLINPQYVVTAAHCLSYGSHPSTTFIKLGVHDRNSETDYQLIAAEKFIPNRSFFPQTMEADIGLIKLSSPAVINERVSPICISAAKDLDGQTGTVIGWGHTSFEGELSNLLMKLDLQTISNTECIKSYENVPKSPEIRKTNICAHAEYKDACNDDSGGPFVITNSTNQHVLTGIVSFGYECGTHNAPTVFTRVSSYIPWIQRQLKDKSSICIV